MSTNDEFCIKNEEFGIRNEDLCITNEEICTKHDEFCSVRTLTSAGFVRRPIPSKLFGRLRLFYETERGRGSKGVKPEWEKGENLCLNDGLCIKMMDFV